MKVIERINVCRYDHGTVKNLEDMVIREIPFTIFLNDEELITLLCIPRALEYLAIGFLLSEGFIKEKEDIKDMKLFKEKGIIEIQTKNEHMIAKELFGKRMVTTGCGKGTIFYNIIDSFHSKKINEDMLQIKASDIVGLVGKFNKTSPLFLNTGGVHSASMSDGKELLLFHEDVGRHNAVDKVMGEAMMKNISLKDKCMLTSGRISSEILMKAAKRGVPMIVSKSAPTDSAVHLGKKLGITIIGFVRGNRMNIYSEEQRIML